MECQHDFKEEYHGVRCSKCDLFYAFGCAPWDEPENDEDFDDDDDED